MMSHVTTRRIATVAIVILLAFPALVITANVIQRDEYSAASNAVSLLALGRAGWLMTLAFVALGMGTILIAVTVRRSLKRALVGPACLTVGGLLTLLSAVFQADRDGAASTIHGQVHMALGLTTFHLVVGAIAACGVAFRRSDDWRSFSKVSVIWAALALAEIISVFVLPDGVFGVAQRSFLATCIIWMVVTATLAIRRPAGEEARARGISNGMGANPNGVLGHEA
jgi:hypothetical membrane protein